MTSIPSRIRHLRPWRHLPRWRRLATAGSLLGACAALAMLAAAALHAPAAAAQDVLRPEKAYPYEVKVDAGRLRVQFDILDGYYLYRNRFGFASKTPGVMLGEPEYPRGQAHEDKYFGKQEIYRGGFEIAIPYVNVDGSNALTLEVRLQGCADIGLCYPPQTWTRDVSLPAGAGVAASSEASATGGGGAAGGAEAGRSAADLAGAGAGAGAGQSDSGAAPFLPRAGTAPLSVDEAFAMNARFDSANELTVGWKIEPGYYLYRDKLGVAAEGDIELGTPSLPAGQPFSDDNFGDVQIFRDYVELKVPFARASPGEIPVTIRAAFQGCKDGSICYPPSVQTMALDVPAADSFAQGSTASGAAAGVPLSEQDRLVARAISGSWLVMLGLFYLGGLGLAFTPCVLPMVPIVSSIIAGHGAMTAKRGFALSFSYVMGMAFTYTIAGALAALVGQQVQAVFQKPWIIASFAGVFVLLALSMFGLFNVQMPAAVQTRVAALANRQKAGSFIGTGVMGALSALIVTTCVAPALVAALALIGQQGDIARGAAALFALSLGMGSPLLVVGASAGTLLPKVGAWMNTVKAAFGVMLLGLAIWMLERVLPGNVALVLWAVLVFLTGVFLGAFEPLPETPGAARRLCKGVGVLACLYGALMLVGATLGGKSPLEPIPRDLLAGTGARSSSAAAEPVFAAIESVSQLDSALAAARDASRPVLVDFTADWCVSCKEMEEYTFPDAQVVAALAPFTLLRVDVTANDDDDKALLKRFDSFGPPTIAFFDSHGMQQDRYKLVGFVPAERFAEHVQSLAAL